MTRGTLIIENVAALRELVRQCAADSRALVDYGLAHAELGHAPPADHVRMAHRGGVLEHYRDDFTVRVAGGCTIGMLQEALDAAGQMLPIDADDDLSVGECISHGVGGPLRAGYGSLRDLLLGLAFVDGAGRDVRPGGRTVKNVAGLDLSRFMVGSLGEMGVIHEATLRTWARPTATLNVSLRVEDPARLDAHLTRWMVSQAWPAHLLLHRDADAAEAVGWKVVVGYHGSPGVCAAQQRELELLAKSIPGLAIEEARAGDLADDRDRRARCRAWRRRAAVLVKVTVPPASTGALCKTLAGVGDAQASGSRLRIDALPAHGCLWVGGDLDASAATSLDAAILEAINALGGLCIWHRRPADAVNRIEPFAPAQGDWRALMNLKRALDPANILNPGRFLRLEVEGQA